MGLKKRMTHANGMAADEHVSVRGIFAGGLLRNRSTPRNSGATKLLENSAVFLLRYYLNEIL